MTTSLRNYWRALPVGAGVVALVAVLSRNRHEPVSLIPPPDEDPVVTAIEKLRVRGEVRMRLAREVADGRRSVFEAAALFRELDRTPPAGGPPRPDLGLLLPAPFPAGTEDEAYCRQVALFAYVALRDEEPDRAVAVVARLADEVRAEVQARGAVRLPDPATLEPVERLLQGAQDGRAPPAAMTPIGW